LINEEGALATQMVVKKLQTSPPTASRNLQKLQKAGYLTQKGKGRSTYYLLPTGTRLEELENLKQELDSYRPLPEPIVDKINSMLTCRFIYATRAIEGAKLPLRETALILAGTSIKGDREEISDVFHQKKTLDLVNDFVNNNLEISESFIKNLQKEVTSNTADVMLNGVYRDHEASIAGTVKIFPDPADINELMSAYIASILRMAKKKQHPAIIAAYAHYKFLTIHPFADGNGRTARLIMNSIMLKYHYPVTIIESSRRNLYYQVLQRADEGAYEIFASFIYSAIKESLELYLKFVRP